MLAKSAKRKTRGNRFSLLYVCDVLVAVVFLVSSPNLRSCEERLKVKKYKPFQWIWSSQFTAAHAEKGLKNSGLNGNSKPDLYAGHRCFTSTGSTAQLVVHCIGFFRGLGSNPRSSLKISALSWSINPFGMSLTKRHPQHFKAQQVWLLGDKQLLFTSLIMQKIDGNPTSSSL